MKDTGRGGARANMRKIRSSQTGAVKTAMCLLVIVVMCKVRKLTPISIVDALHGCSGNLLSVWYRPRNIFNDILHKSSSSYVNFIASVITLAKLHYFQLNERVNLFVC